MARWHGMLHSVKSLVRRADADRETTEEIAYHIERQAQRHIESGIDPALARARALQEFGGVGYWREATGDARAGHLVDDVLRDVRHARRSLARTPSFTIAAILTTAVGIGAATSAIGLLDAVLHRELPFANPDRIVSIYEANDKNPDLPFSAPNFVEWKAAAQSVDRMAAIFEQRVAIGAADHPVIANAARVTGEFFDVFSIEPLRGRTLRPNEPVPTAVLSEGLWQTVFGGDSTIVGKTAQLGLQRIVIVGVLPRRFSFPDGVQLWLSRKIDASGPRNVIGERVVGRLAPGRTIQDARAEFRAIAERWHRLYPDEKENQATSATVRAFREDLIAPVRPLIIVLTATLGLVLSIGCVNLTAANLARNLARQREIALRAVLGAGRVRLARHLVIEGAIVAGVGSALGIAIAAIVLKTFPSVAPTTLPGLLSVELDARALAYGVLASLLIGIAGAAVSITRIPVDRLGMMLGSTRVAAGRTRGRLLLIAGESAMAVLLLVAAGLSMRTTRMLLHRDNGFDPSNLLTVETRLPPKGYGRPGAAAALYEDVLARIRTLPGVEHAAATTALPLAPAGLAFITIEGRQTSTNPPDIAGYRLVSDDFFATMGMPLLAGRSFLPSDDSTSEHVTVISQSMAKKFWPGVNPIGERIRAKGWDDHGTVWLRVIGIVPDVRHWTLEAEMTPEHYIISRQRPERAYNFNLVVRSSLPTATLVPAVRRAILASEEGVATEFTTMDARIAQSIRDRRFTMLVLTALGGVAIVLVIVGIYGVFSFLVTQRTREVGIRLAIGAERAQVQAMVLREALRPVVLGAAVGLAAAVAAARTLRSLTVDASPIDVWTYAGAVVVLVVVAAAASYFPARRASSVDPMISLRVE